MSLTDNLTHSNSAEYEERLIAFIDLLGFQLAIEKSASDEGAQTREALYEALYRLQGDRLVDFSYDRVPVLTGEGKLTTAGKAGLKHISQHHFPIVATQFSDSFVLSCPAENKGSCLMLLGVLDKLQHIFFENLGILMRGGVYKGALIHEQGGPLFGPAMNKAYALESKSAIYPRILFDAEAAKHMKSAWGDGSSPIFTTFDGHQALDLVSTLACRHGNDSQEWISFNDQLIRVEQDIRENYCVALPKVAYLKDRLLQQQNQR